ncbi:hypothetical protein RUM44_003011 [Polyplax serrata]|uniref:Rab-GAP TBC domain-containing protein n=2 Tax=Polyplax serrata TaxID=468196 RepID=A0ABR1AXC7_POLSC
MQLQVSKIRNPKLEVSEPDSYTLVIMQNRVSENDSKASFWKKNTKAVPGRPSPKKEYQNRSATTSSFQEFENSVSDAWSIGDNDDDNDLLAIADVTLSKKAAQSAAISVIQNHHISQLNDSLTEKRKTEAMQRLAMQQTVPVENSPGRKPPRKMLEDFNLTSKESEESELIKIGKFSPLINSPILNLDELRSLSWSGIPPRLRSMTWKLLAGYLPASLERREAVLERKRKDYWGLVYQYYHTDCNETYQDIYHQIHIDIPRMSPEINLFQQESVQQIFERILFIWAIRHPASGYVQGINDLVTPFFIVFLQEILPENESLNTVFFDNLPKESRDAVEADAFWCLSKFLDGIQDNYIFAQLGIQQKVNQLKELIQRIDVPLHKHLQNHGVDYLQFSFRWINNLLTRELPLRCTIRLWDTYLAEADGLAAFQLYVCAAFLIQWRKEILNQKDFQSLMLLLQKVPTEKWSECEIGVLVAEAYRLKFTYADAPNHLQGND